MKRYEIAQAINGGLMVEDEDGDYVLHDEAQAALTAAYAEGRKDQAEDDRDSNASRLIDAWCAAHGKPMPWAKSIELIAIVTKMPDAEKQRLLSLAD